MNVYKVTFYCAVVFDVCYTMFHLLNPPSRFTVEQQFDCAHFFFAIIKKCDKYSKAAKNRLASDFKIFLMYKLSSFPNMQNQFNETTFGCFQPLV